MIIPPDEYIVKGLHTALTELCRGGDHPVEQGYISEGLVKGSIEYATMKDLYGKPIHRHVLQQAAVLLHSIITFHPFVDGNKRTALCAVYYLLAVNGYEFNIPSDSVEFTRNIAKPEERVTVNEVLDWLVENTRRTIFSTYRNFTLTLSYRSGTDLHLVWRRCERSVPMPLFVLEELIAKAYRERV